MATDAMRADAISGRYTTQSHCESEYHHSNGGISSCHHTKVLIPHLVKKYAFWGVGPPELVTNNWLQSLNSAPQIVSWHRFGYSRGASLRAPMFSLRVGTPFGRVCSSPGNSIIITMIVIIVIIMIVTELPPFPGQIISLLWGASMLSCLASLDRHTCNSQPRSDCTP